MATVLLPCKSPMRAGHVVCLAPAPSLEPRTSPKRGRHHKWSPGVIRQTCAKALQCSLACQGLRISHVLEPSQQFRGADAILGI